MPRVPISSVPPRGVLSRLLAKKVPVKANVNVNVKQASVVPKSVFGPDSERVIKGKAGKPVERMGKTKKISGDEEEYWPELLGVEEGHVKISLARLENLASRPPTRKSGFVPRYYRRLIPKSSTRISELGDQKPSLLPKLEAASDGLVAVQLVNMAFVLSSRQTPALRGLRATTVQRNGRGFEVIFADAQDKLTAMRNPSWVSLLSGTANTSTPDAPQVPGEGGKGFGIVVHSVSSRGFIHAESKDLIKQLYTENPWDPTEISVLDAHWIENVHRTPSTKRGYRSLSISFMSTPQASTIQKTGLFFNGQFRSPEKIVPLTPNQKRSPHHTNDETERLESTREIVVFSDASKIGLEAGAAVWRKADSLGGEIRKMYALGTRMAVFDAELYALHKAIRVGGRLAARRGVEKLTVCADSQAALAMMARGTAGPGLRLARCGRADMLMLYQNHGVRVVLEWVRAHAGVRGNARADGLARAACSIRRKVRDAYTSEILTERLRRREEWVRGCRERRAALAGRKKGKKGMEDEDEGGTKNYVVSTGYGSPFRPYDVPVVFKY